MRRQRRTPHNTDDDEYYPAAAAAYQPLGNEHNGGDVGNFLQMEYLSQSKTHKPHRFENTIEAKVEIGDTLQALALRFHCTVADIKRLNKIDKDNEIHARKVVKIPLTVHSVLLGALPEVHKSGNSSPRESLNADAELESTVRNPLEDARIMLSEKLMVASVNAAGQSVANNNVIDHMKAMESSAIYTDKDPQKPLSATTARELTDAVSSPLLGDLLDDEIVPQPRPIPGPRLSTLDWSGSDCDMSWVCLFVVILALCFVIPLVYVIYLAENPPHHHNNTNH